MSEDPGETNRKMIVPTREKYRKFKEQLREGRKKIDEMEKREEELFKMFSTLFYGNAEKKNVTRVGDSFSSYTSSELEELYPKLQYLAPWKEDVSQPRFMREPTREVVSFLAIYIAADVAALVFISFFVWRLTDNFIYTIFSAAVSGGLMGLLITIRGVIKHVRKKKEE